jgi:hypothetical protein
VDRFFCHLLQVQRRCLQISDTSLLCPSGLVNYSEIDALKVFTSNSQTDSKHSLLVMQIAFAGVVYPCLIFSYMGQAAFLSKNISNISRSFYDSIPGRVKLLYKVPVFQLWFLESSTWM